MSIRTTITHMQAVVAITGMRRIADLVSLYQARKIGSAWPQIYRSFAAQALF